MKKRIFWIGVASSAVLGIGMPCLAGNASGITTIKSKNTVKYSDEGGTVEICSSDIQLLADKVSTIPSRVFDPANYTHTHSWQYININDSTHTRHCASCGSNQDITVDHSELQKTACNLPHNGNNYSGFQYTCECGYQWSMESGHHYICDYVDEKEHSYSCVLNGTGYCEGFSSYNEEHFADTIEPNDAASHTITCICGYSWAEDCDFTYDAETDEDSGQTLCYCFCGNVTLEVSDDEETDVTDDAAEETEQPQTEQEED